MADVFISYSKADVASAKALADDLTAKGFSVWWDFALYAGDDFHETIRAKIATAKAVVVIWSESAAGSKWVRGEAEEASDLGTLISTHISGFDPRRVPINFRALHCENLANLDRIAAAIDRKGASRRSVSTLAKPATSAAEQTALAATNNMSATELLRLGCEYLNGTYSRQQSDELAFRYINKAAQLNSPRAQGMLGYLHKNGIGVARNDAEAARLYRLAVAGGDHDSCCSLAEMYLHGKGVEKDVSQAIRLYKHVSDQGDYTGAMALGEMYENGLGVDRNYSEAYGWYNIARCAADIRSQAIIDFCDEALWRVAKLKE